jgi:hypothetical protein
MAAKIEYQRHKDKTASIAELLAHDKYLNDPTHDDHGGYTMLPGKNYNCGGATIDDLVAGIELAHKNYIRRKKLLKIRRRTSQLWGEAIFNLGLGTFITKDERDKIEGDYIRRFFRDTAARAYWHVNETTGQCDLHIIFAHKRPCGKLTLERTETGMSKRLQALDRFAADLLNNNPDKPENRIPDIRTAEDTAEAHAQYYSEIREMEEAAELAEEEAKNPAKKAAKKSPIKTNSTAQSRKLAAQVARKAEEEGIVDVEAHHLVGILQRLKIKILGVFEGIIKYESSRKIMKGKTSDGEVRKPRTGIIWIHDFLFEVLHVQVDLRIERDRKKALENSKPGKTIQRPNNPVLESPPVESPNVESSALKVSTVELQTPEVVAAPTTKAKAKSPEEKAATLQLYLEVMLGRTKVSTTKRVSLVRAAKDMLKPDGTIKPGILKSVPPEKMDVLVRLAAESAKNIQ